MTKIILTNITLCALSPHHPPPTPPIPLVPYPLWVSCMSPTFPPVTIWWPLDPVDPTKQGHIMITHSCYWWAAWLAKPRASAQSVIFVRIIFVTCIYSVEYEKCMYALRLRNRRKLARRVCVFQCMRQLNIIFRQRGVNSIKCI